MLLQKSSFINIMVPFVATAVKPFLEGMSEGKIIYTYIGVRKTMRVL